MREHNDADGSGSTAQFRAFVDRSGGTEATQAWSMRAPRNRVATFAAVAVATAIVLGLIVFLLIG
jgi:hypothetical protein